jgi:hypothetical protein
MNNNKATINGLSDGISVLEKDNTKENRYTYLEIEKMFREDKSLPIEYKMHVSAKLDAIYQAMYQSVHEKDTLNVTNPYGDHWLEEFNRVAELYQKYKENENYE